MTKTLEQALEIYNTVKDCSDLEKRAQAIAQALDGLTGEENIAAIATLEDEYLRSRFSSKSIGTKMSAAGYNKLIRQIALVDGQNSQQVSKKDGSKLLKHLFYKFCGLSKHEFDDTGETPNEWDERNASSRVYERLQANIEVNPTDQIKTGYKLLQSTIPWEIAAGLIALSGRRPHEIVARAVFKLIEGQEYQVQFSGQGKKRGAEPAFPVSILIPADAFLKAFRKFRANPEVKEVLRSAMAEAPGDSTKQNRVVDKLTNKRLNRIVKRDFAAILPPRVEVEGHSQAEDEADINCTALKSAYLAIATKRDCEGSPARQMLFASKLAGHFIDINLDDKEAFKRIDSKLRHLVTTLGYMSYDVKGEVPFFKVPLPEVEHIPHRKLPVTRLQVEENKQLDEWCQLWECSKVEAMSKIFQLAKERLSMPTQPEVHQEAKEMEPVTQVDNSAVEKLKEQFESYQRQTDQKFEKLIQLLQGQQTTLEQPEPANDVESSLEPKITTDRKVPAKPLRDWESVPKAELFGEGDAKPAKGTGATEERLRRSIEAVMTWNDQFPADSHSEKKWSINIRAIRDLAGANNDGVREFIEAHPHWVDDHNQKHGIADQYHNRCHKAPGKTTKDLILEEVYPLIK